MRVRCTKIMAKQIQLRRGTTVETNNFTGAAGEVTYNNEKKLLVVHDGSTVGGFEVPKMLNGKVAQVNLDIPEATTTVKGIVQLNNTLTSTSTTQAATPAQVKILADRDFGIDQTLQNVTASRVLRTTYTNTTGKLIFVSVTAALNQGGELTATVNGLVVCRGFAQNSASQAWAGFFVPPSGNYSVSAYTLNTWVEYK